MRIKHIFWVVSSQFIYTAELNELLVNAWVSKFFLFLDVAVCVKISMELPLIQLVDLVL